MYLLSGRKPVYLVLIIPELILSALVNILVKSPLANLVGTASGYGVTFAIGMPIALLLFYAFLAPVTEEAIKVTPLLIPPVRRLADTKLSALWVGFALGIGFGLGEVIYLALQVNSVPEYATLPWYYFTGFLIERIMAVFAHGVLTSIFVAAISYGLKWGIAGYLVSVLLHFILNLGAALLPLGLIDQVDTLLLLVITVLAFWGIFEGLRRYLRRHTIISPNLAVSPEIPAEGHTTR